MYMYNPHTILFHQYKTKNGKRTKDCQQQRQLTYILQLDGMTYRWMRWDNKEI
jgi:hypothetical protein